jgi:hypothetical protein
MKPIRDPQVVRFLAVTLLIAPLHAAEESSGGDALGSLMYRSHQDALALTESGFTVRKKSGRAQLHRIVEYPGNPDIQMDFRDVERGFVSTVTIYRAPEGAAGPQVLLDDQGNPRLEDPAKNPAGVFALSEPSESYLKEFRQRISIIEQRFPLKCVSKLDQPLRMLAVPNDLKRSPVAYVAHFGGTGGFRGPHFTDTPWFWEFRLYVHRGWFVKIHTEGPLPKQDENELGALAILGPLAFATEVVNAVEWLKE